MNLKKSLYLSILLLISCSKKTTPPVVIEPTIAEPSIEILDQEIAEEEIEDIIEEKIIYLLAELQRTACYGKCPVFTIKLYSDGRVTYEGKAHSNRIGTFEAFINPQDFESIFEAANQANYFVLQNQYPTDAHQISDLPKTISYLKRNGLEKRIINNHAAPKELQTFEKWLEQFFENLTWKKIN